MVCIVLSLIKISQLYDLNDKTESTEILFSIDLVAALMFLLEDTNSPKWNSQEEQFEDNIHVCFDFIIFLFNFFLVRIFVLAYYISLEEKSVK